MQDVTKYVSNEIKWKKRLIMALKINKSRILTSHLTFKPFKWNEFWF